jgi:hypothetical protein
MGMGIDNFAKKNSHEIPILNLTSQNNLHRHFNIAGKPDQISSMTESLGGSLNSLEYSDLKGSSKKVLV